MKPQARHADGEICFHILKNEVLEEKRPKYVHLPSAICSYLLAFSDV